MDGSSNEEGWGDLDLDLDADPRNNDTDEENAEEEVVELDDQQHRSLSGNRNEISPPRKAPPTPPSQTPRATRWESGKGRCAITGRRVLGGTEGLRRVMV